MFQYALLFLPGLFAGLAAFGGRFDRIWRFFWSSLLGVYLALWSMPAVLPSILKMGEVERQYGPAAVLLAAALVSGCVLFFASGKLYSGDVNAEYLPFLSRFTGFFAVWAAVTVITGFLLLILLLSPAVKFVPRSYAEFAENFACRTLLVSSRLVDKVSLQSAQEEPEIPETAEAQTPETQPAGEQTGEAANASGNAPSAFFSRRAWLTALIVSFRPAAPAAQETDPEATAAQEGKTEAAAAPSQAEKKEAAAGQPEKNRAK